MDLRASAVTYSFLLHLFVILAVTVSMPFLAKKPVKTPPAIIIEFAKIDKESKTPEFDKSKKKQVVKKEPVKTSVPKLDNKPKKAKKSSGEKPVVAIAKPMKPPKKRPKKKQPVIKVDKKDKKQDEDFSSILKNLMDSDPEEDEIVKKKPKNITPTKTGAEARLGDTLTMSEEDSFRRQFERCWNVPIGAKDIENTVIEIRLQINRDKTLRSASLIDNRRYNSDGFYRAIADSAMRAVRNPDCSPFELPDSKYSLWSTTIVTFNPRDMF